MFKDITGLKKVTFPSTLERIGDYAFNECTSLTNVTFPSTSTLESTSTLSIGDYAFKGCTSLTNDQSITFPNKISTIGEHAFDGVKLTMNLPNTSDWAGFDSIGAFAFNGCEGLKGSLKFSDNIEQIPENAFKQCYGLNNIIFSDYITQIGASAFYDCNQITGELILPNDLESLGESAFYNCSKLSGSWANLPKNISNIEKNAFYGCKKINGKLTIPGQIKNLKSSVFYGCTGINSLDLKNVTKIEEYCFNNCIGIENVQFHYVSNIGNYAFYNCYQLNIGENSSFTNISSIGNYAFYNCSGLSGELTFGERISSIGESAFEECDGFTSIVLPSSLTTLSNNAFKNCSKVTNIDLGQLTQISELSSGCFDWCDNVKILYYPASMVCKSTSFSSEASIAEIHISKGTGNIKDYSDNVKNDRPWLISSSSKINIIMDDDIETISSYMFSSNKIIKFKVSNNLKSIGKNAFDSANSLEGIYLDEAFTTKNFPNTLESIGEAAFKNCTSLKGNYKIPDGITKIERYTFESCESIVEIELSNNITEINDGAFINCSNMDFKEGTNLPSSLKSFGYNSFANCKSITEITIPYNVQSIPGKQEGIVIEENKQGVFKNCEKLVSVNIARDNNGIYNLSEIGPYAFRGCSNLKDFEWNDYIKTIGKEAFQNCISLTGFNEAYQFIGIGESAFSGCNTINTVYINKELKSLGSEAFRSCGKIENIIIADQTQLECLSYNCFEGNNNIKNITLPISFDMQSNSIKDQCSNLQYVHYTKGSGTGYHYSNTTSNIYYSASNNKFNPGITVELEEDITGIGNYTFADDDNSNITKVILPSTLKRIGIGAFQNCKNMDIYKKGDSGTYEKTYELPTTINYIEKEAFRECLSLEATVDLTNVTKINEYTFYDCKNIDVINTNNITEIMKYAFCNCQNLKDFNFTDNIINIEQGAFQKCTQLPYVYLGKNIKILGTNAFHTCSGIKEIEINEDIGLSKLETGLFDSTTSLKKLTIPISLYSDNAINNCLNLSSVHFTLGKGKSSYTYTVDTAKKTPWYIASQNNLNEGITVTFDDNIIEIGDIMFYNSSRITGMVLPSALTTIGEFAFYGCTSLDLYSKNEDKLSDTTNFPTGITSIGTSAFCYCQNITGVLDLSKLEKIKESTFYQCYKLDFAKYNDNNIIKMPNVTIINKSAFYDCTSLSGTIDLSKYTEIKENVFHGCSSLNEVIFSDNLEIIDNYAFYNCSSINQGINFKSKEISIGQYAFENCTNLTGSFDVKSSPEMLLGNGAFKNSGFNEVKIDRDVDGLNCSIFENCAKLEKLTLPISYDVSSNAQYSIFNGCKNINEIIFIKGANEQTAAVSYNWRDYRPWFISSQETYLTVKFEEGITEIGASMFQDCKKLKDIYLPTSLVKIHNYAFYDCKGLKTINYASTEEKWDSLIRNSGSYIFSGVTDNVVSNVKCNVNYSIDN